MNRRRYSPKAQDGRYCEERMKITKKKPYVYFTVYDDMLSETFHSYEGVNNKNFSQIQFIDEHWDIR